MNGVVIEETVRRHVMSVAYGAYVAFLAIVALGVSKFDKAGAVWPSLVALLAFIAGCRPIGPEFSAGTLQLILAKPLTRASYLVSRVAGVVLVVWLATLVAFMTELTGRALWSDDPRVDALTTTLLNSAVDTILICALLALLGSLTRAYYNIAIYVAAGAGISILQGLLGMARNSTGAFGQFLLEYPSIERGLDVISRNLFPELPPRLDVQWLLLVLSNAMIALVIACLVFRRREVPYGAD